MKVTDYSCRCQRELVTEFEEDVYVGDVLIFSVCRHLNLIFYRDSYTKKYFIDLVFKEFLKGNVNEFR